MSADERLGAAPRQGRLASYVEIARPDHWVKNVFVVPGWLLGVLSGTDADAWTLAWRAGIGLCAVCLAASSNYVINEILDAPYDRHHPAKRDRPIPSGRVEIRLAYAEWLLLAVASLVTSAVVGSLAFLLVIAWLLVMGGVYNAPPLRMKDRVYADVLTESVNNPIRLLAGWYLVQGPAPPPLSLMVAYWMIGAYFMALKRYAEFGAFPDARSRGAYRRSLGTYTRESLLVSIVFYVATAMLFLGTFMCRYRLELVLSFPLLAHAMAEYMRLSFKPDSPVQAPEHLYRERALVLSLIAFVVAASVLLVVDMQWLYDYSVTSFSPADRLRR